MSEFVVVMAEGRATAGALVPALVLSGVLGAALVCSGRAQRRSGRMPTRRYQLGGLLHEPLVPRKVRRVVGGVSEAFGWMFVVLALVIGIQVLGDVLS